jgi:hypothetical protein
MLVSGLQYSSLSPIQPKPLSFVNALLQIVMNKEFFVDNIWIHNKRSSEVKKGFQEGQESSTRGPNVPRAFRQMTGDVF